MKKTAKRASLQGGFKILSPCHIQSAVRIRRHGDQKPKPKYRLKLALTTKYIKSRISINTN